VTLAVILVESRLTKFISLREKDFDWLFPPIKPKLPEMSEPIVGFALIDVAIGTEKNTLLELQRCPGKT
jgi:hypothetical protein